MMYKKDDRIAVITGPLRYYSTRYWLETETKMVPRGISVTVYHVQIAGQCVFSAPTKAMCQDWLYRQGYFPMR